MDGEEEAEGGRKTRGAAGAEEVEPEADAWSSFVDDIVWLIFGDDGVCGEQRARGGRVRKAIESVRL